MGDFRANFITAFTIVLLRYFRSALLLEAPLLYYFCPKTRILVQQSLDVSRSRCKTNEKKEGRPTQETRMYVHMEEICASLGHYEKVMVIVALGGPNWVL